MNFCLTPPPLFSIFLKDQNIKKWSRYYIFLKILRLKKVVTLLCTFGQVKKSGHNFLKTYILKNQPQLFKIHTYFEIRKTSLSKKNKKAMQTLRWTPPPPTQTNMNNLATPPPPEPVTQFMDAPLLGLFSPPTQSPCQGIKKRHCFPENLQLRIAAPEAMHKI